MVYSLVSVTRLLPSQLCLDDSLLIAVGQSLSTRPDLTGTITAKVCSLSTVAECILLSMVLSEFSTSVLGGQMSIIY